MGDPKTIRINNADQPDRLERFEQTLKKTAGDGGEVIRQLVDAYNLYVAENGHAPNFPVRLVPAIGTAVKPKRGR